MSHDDHDLSQRDPVVLLRALGSDMPAPATAVRNVFNRLAAELPAGALGTAEPDGTSPTDGGGVFGNGVVAVARPWAWAVGLTLAGGVTGGALHAAFAPEKERVVYVDRQSTAGSTAAALVAQGVAAVRATAASTEAPPAPALTEPSRTSFGEPAPGSSTAGNSTWAKERALLDTARRALAAGDPEACLTELAKHARAFPSGKLAEERQAMAINALVGVGRYAEARQRAELFARRYPHSFLAPSVEAAISAIP